MTIFVSTVPRSITTPSVERQRFGQQARIGVIFGEMLRAVFERDESRRGQHARLPHAAA